MLEALAAESLKLGRHKATWFLVWIYPILFTIIFLIAIAVGMAGADPPDSQRLDEWIGETALIWGVPGNSVGRFMIAAFVAVVFAGEYGWNTWKLVVPHRSRSALIAAKYALVLILLTSSFALTALITVFGSWAEDVLTGDTVPAGITASALAAEHGRAALTALAPALLTIGYASLAAILTRSMVAALVISIVVVSIEQLLFNFAPMLSARFPSLIWGLYHGLPGYHLANLGHWTGEGAAHSVAFPSGAVVGLGWTTSLAVLGAWIAGLIGATFALFRRQDIN